MKNSDPSPPSSQSPSLEWLQSLAQIGSPLPNGGGCDTGGGGAGAGGGGGATSRRPQSEQSVPTTQYENSEPVPPSSQSPSEA